MFFRPRIIDCFSKNYGKRSFLKDCVSGVTVGIIALPLAMAFSIASGVGPEKGLFTAIIAGFLISALGGSRLQIGGPTGAFVVIVFEVVRQYGYDGLVLATLMAGVMLILFGISGLGAMIKYIPYPVTTGFTAGIAVIIFTSQIKDFLGLSIHQDPSKFLEKWEVYFHHLNSFNSSSLLIGGTSLLSILFFRKFFPRIPGTLFALILAAALTHFFELDVETIGSRFGEIPNILPRFSWPEMDFEKMERLISPAFTIALLAGIESLLSAVVADGMSGDKHHSDTELIAQGVANIASVGFGGIPATGAIARTATNIRSGAQSPISGVIHALTLMILMFLVAPLVKTIPLSALAAVLMVVAWNMSEIPTLLRLLKAPKSDIVVLIVVLSLTVLVDLTVAVETGVVLAALLFMRRMSQVQDTVTHLEAQGEESEIDPAEIQNFEIPKGVEIYEINGPFFFGVADRLENVLQEIRTPPKALILRMRRVTAIDATGLHALEEFYRKTSRQGTRLILAAAPENVLKKLDQFGLMKNIGEKNIIPSLKDGISHAKKLLTP